MKKRDYYIDFIRGIAALWIILIHTCFWSGSSYLPDWVAPLSLIIDVPLFIFISGMSFNFSNSLMNTVKGLVKIWECWLIFLVLYFLLGCVLNDNINFEIILSSLFYQPVDSLKLPVVYGSIWFMFMYTSVTLICNTIIVFYKKYNDKLDNFKYLVIGSFLLYGMSLYNPSFFIFSTYILMHCFIYLLGYYLYNYEFKSIFKYLIIMLPIIVTLLVGIKYGSYSFLNMQAAKVDLSISYLLYSMIFILTFFFLKKYVIFKKKNIICWIGENALLFYFCQGIGASLIYRILPYINNYSWYIMLLIMLLANIAITSVLAVILYYLRKAIKRIKFKIDFLKLVD